MSRDDDPARRLSSLDRFSALSEHDLKRIAKAGTHVHQPANWTLMAEGTGSDKAYVILSGEASVRKGGEEIATVGPGDPVGEMGVVDHKLRSASVVSTSELDVLHFTRQQLERLAEEIPAFGEALRSGRG